MATKKSALNIKTKLLLLAVTSGLIFVICYFVQTHSLSTIKQLQYADTLNAEVYTDILMLRRNEKDFMARKDLKYQTKLDKNFNLMVEKSNELRETLDKNGLDTSGMIRFQESAQKYKNSFNNIVAIQKKIGLTEKDGLHGSLRDSVQQAEQQIKSLGDYKLLSDILMLRRNEKDFLQRLNMKYLDKFGKNLDIMKQHLMHAEIGESEKGEIAGYMEAYKKDFINLVNTYKEKGLTPKEGKHGEMRDSAHNLENVLKSIEGDIHHAIEKKSSNAEKLALGVFIFFSLLIIAFILLLSSQILGSLHKILSLAKDLAEGDSNLSKRLEIETRDEIGMTGYYFDSFLNIIGNIISQTMGVAKKTALEAEGMLNSVRQISGSMTSQADRASQVATSSEELSQTVIDIAKNASDISTTMEGATNIANEGQSIVNQSVEEVRTIATTVRDSADLISGLGERSKQIGEIVNVINDIADQTNLLALNAAIEAARAGEQGRGFAVVADEVRKLAERTAGATSEISDMIRAIQGEVDKAVAAMNNATDRVETGVDLSSQAGDALSKIVDSIGELNALIQQIATSTEEMSTVTGQISEDISNVAEVSRESYSEMEQLSASASNLSDMSHNVSSMLGQFQCEDEACRGEFAEESNNLLPLS